MLVHDWKCVIVEYFVIMLNHFDVHVVIHICWSPRVYTLNR